MVSDKGTMVIWEHAPTTNILCQGVGYAQEWPYTLNNAARSFAVASLCSTSSIVKCLSGSTIFSPNASTNTLTARLPSDDTPLIDDPSNFCGRCEARSEDLTDFVWSRECRAILRCL
ncbi:hypothetical protein M758_UG061900 [Ceratodon purpureus]|nr:hypothetical protein M758_UG061900 [Ceratodon purpureus]